MASTKQNTTAQASTQTANTASANDSVKSIADALASLPKETEQTMKGFLDQQMANAKNVNDELVEQFGSAIDNSEFADSMKEVKEAFRKKAENDAKNQDAEKQKEHFTKIQNDLDKILEIQGEALRADVKRDETVYNDTALNDVEEKADEKVDENTDVVKEDIKPVDVKVDVQLPNTETEIAKEDSAADVPSKEENLLNDIVSAQTEQNALLTDIGQKLTDVGADDNVDEDKTTEPSKEESLLKDIVSAQTEQNVLLNDIGQKLTEPEVNDVPEDNTPKEPTEPDDANVAQQDSEPDEATKATETAFAEVNTNLGKINDSIDDMLDELGDSVANTDVDEPQPISVNVDVVNPEKDVEENPDVETKPQSVELAKDSLNSIRELVDEAKQNETELMDAMNKRNEKSLEDVEPSKSDSITEIANDISGATDAMNNQDETPLESKEDEKVAPEDSKRLDQAVAEKNTQFDEATDQVSSMEEQTMVLDPRMDMAARAERDITPVLNEVQMFNRMSLTKEEIQVLASEIGRSVAENLIDRDAEKRRDAAYLDEVERMTRG